MTSTHTAVRITTIDFLRGAVMIIMALDHTRDYFHAYSYYYNPVDLQHTSPAIFFTRWITHFCAPVFVFLAGTSAFLSGQKKTKQQLSVFLLKRGLWLMLLEITLVSFGWFFNPLFSLWVLQVIWVLGLSMIVLAGLVHLPVKAIMAIGLAMVLGHNLLDNMHVAGNTATAFGWAELHDFRAFTFRNIIVVSAYPLIPWAGVMALGYCFGRLFLPAFDAARRKRTLLIMGAAGITLFILLRFINIYGDSSRWAEQGSAVFSLMSFLNTSKYPPSLLYLLMTLSPAFLFLAVADQFSSRIAAIVSTYGRVPMMYYLVHIYVLHFFALLLAQFTGFGWHQMIITKGWITDNASLQGYGLSLPMVYIIWLVTVLAMYPLCRKYDRYKQNNRQQWWLSYL
ncbi:MAG: heparan-alpha-glucosaminide N-acetyltransferase domain-containing protein [Chitinophagaceae bacterium]